ncbi:hypothetical protein [Runella slithyformis]|uniref:Uncharacterized protein n=1 Tax=Runella slithyformis (strain ATCC 29530 / DSM 19594 / LMG 11500 / NCIMB 11436 / LSU 4) TaxID=761193 RepID=A0A7U3ZGD1_RUNSL|nr:hypothetical protein [Runella slithyformis]AEI46727.1 hypothetical protein Runsl_0274 [Runella slithyformis DSM 19594]
MTHLRKRALIAGLFFVISLQGFTQKEPKDSTKVKLGPLFKKEEMLEFTLTTDFTSLMKDRKNAKQPYRWARLEYGRKKKGAVALNIRVKVRGNFRRSPSNCTFPPLLLNIPNKKDKNTVFERQNLLKLVTHCQNEEYIFQEYLVYKMFNLLTDQSFKARLAKVTYQDSAGKRESETRLAFLLEEESYMAKRNGTKNLYRKQIPMYLIDSVNMATVSVFEYMIGNTDWSVPFLHNIKLLDHTTYITAVPYDFDHSGIIEAKYARPPVALDLYSVRQRIYRGINYPPAVMQQVFENFRRVKPQIYALYEENPQLDKGYIKRTLKYLDEFYKTINDPKAVKEVFSIDNTPKPTIKKD